MEDQTIDSFHGKEISGIESQKEEGSELPKSRTMKFQYMKRGSGALNHGSLGPLI
jgi:hypothetical protein